MFKSFEIFDINSLVYFLIDPKIWEFLVR